MRIVGIVLAAGAGRRMGGPKALLTIEETTFLGRCVDRLTRPGVSSVVAVVGCEAARVAAALPPAAGLATNPRWQEGMLGSVIRGLDDAEARGADAVLLHPVDHPLLETATVDRVVLALETGAVVAVPSHAGRRGHPGGFSRVAWPALRAADPGRGARAVLSDHSEWVVHVEGDAGCVTGIDTPDDYERWIGPPRVR